MYTAFVYGSEGDVIINEHFVHVLRERSLLEFSGAIQKRNDITINEYYREFFCAFILCRSVVVLLFPPSWIAWRPVSSLQPTTRSTSSLVDSRPLLMLMVSPPTRRSTLVSQQLCVCVCARERERERLAIQYCFNLGSLGHLNQLIVSHSPLISARMSFYHFTAELMVLTTISHQTCDYTTISSRPPTSIFGLRGMRKKQIWSGLDCLLLASCSMLWISVIVMSRAFIPLQPRTLSSRFRSCLLWCLVMLVMAWSWPSLLSASSSLRRSSPTSRGEERWAEFGGTLVIITYSLGIRICFVWMAMFSSYHCAFHGGSFLPTWFL